jgi:hypothetical protein
MPLTIDAGRLLRHVSGSGQRTNRRALAFQVGHSHMEFITDQK